MRRFRRRLLVLCAATSLLLCVAVGALWAVSGPYDRFQVRHNRWPASGDVYTYYFAAASYSSTFGLQFRHTHFRPAFLAVLPAAERERMRTQYHPPGLH